MPIPRKGEHKDWGYQYFPTLDAREVLNFLISNAVYWLDKYHIDGLRVDAVASMLYLDYSRKTRKWIPNQFGGRENLEAIHFLKKFNEVVQTPSLKVLVHHGRRDRLSPGRWYPVLPIWAGLLVSINKWNMGWYNDNLSGTWR